MWRVVIVTTKSDFIKEQMQAMHTVNSNDDWCEDIALSMLSTVSHNVKFYTSTGRIDLNIWIIAVAPSSAGKSIAFKSYAVPILQKMKELGGNQNIDYQFSSSFTVEALTEYISKEGNKYGLITRDEISSLFKETSGKGYNVRLQEFLSELYDGRISKRTTIAHGTTESSLCYVTLLGGTTQYLYSVLDKQIFIQGLGSRILWELFPVTKRKINRRSFFNLEGIFRKDAGIEEAAKNLMAIPQHDITIQIDSDGKAAKLLEKKYNEMEDSRTKLLSKDILSLDGIYIGKMFVHLLKLSALKRLSREVVNITRLDKGSTHLLFIELEDAKWAINKIDRFYTNYQQMLKEWRTQPIEKPVTTANARFERFIDILRMRGGTAKRPLLQGDLGFDSKSFRETAQALIEMGKIKMLTEDETRKLSPEVLRKCEINLNNNLPQVYTLILTEEENAEGKNKRGGQSR